MFALSSKYALTLYETVQKRGNLPWRLSERFSLDAVRVILGVPTHHFRLRAVDPAVTEVCALSDYTVEIQPIKTRRSVTHVELRWWRKDGELNATRGRVRPIARLGPAGGAPPSRPAEQR